MKKPKSVATRSLSSTSLSSKSVQHHLRAGWCLLAVFGALGLILETLHGFKFQWYVGLMNSTRREMWTLAHAHGTLLAIVHIVFAVSISNLASLQVSAIKKASRLIWTASILMPAGFFAGGAYFHDGDPGLGILCVPVGALALIFAALLIGLHRPSAKSSE